jgi:hypothetical protein
MTDKPTIPPDFEAATQYRIRLEAVTAERNAHQRESIRMHDRVQALEAKNSRLNSEMAAYTVQRSCLRMSEEQRGCPSRNEGRLQSKTPTARIKHSEGSQS